ncbi:hypothetical protein Tco_0603944 [Tanacetum coccineum]
MFYDYKFEEDAYINPDGVSSLRDSIEVSNQKIVLAEVGSRTSVLPLEVPLDETEASRMDDRRSKKKEMEESGQAGQGKLTQSISQAVLTFEAVSKIEVNDICSDGLARSAIPFALIAASFGIKRSMTVAGGLGDRKSRQSGVSATKWDTCALCKDLDTIPGNAGKPKRVKDYGVITKEKMMMCKKLKQGVPLQTELSDWIERRRHRMNEDS